MKCVPMIITLKSARSSAFRDWTWLLDQEGSRKNHEAACASRIVYLKVIDLSESYLDAQQCFTQAVQKVPKFQNRILMR
jgi:hypothetical protein